MIDKELVLSEAQAVTASAASTNYINQGAAGVAAKPMTLKVRCDTTADSANDTGTVTFSLQTATDSAFTSPVTLASSAAKAIASAELTANGIAWEIAVPKGALQYLRVYYTVGTETLSAGKFDAFLTDAEISQ